MGVLTSGLYRILNCLPIYFLLSHVVKLFRSRSKTGFYLVYIGFVLGLLHTLSQTILFSITLTNFRFANLSIYLSSSFRSLCVGMFDNDPLTIVGLALFIIHVENVVHYLFFDLMRYFEPECDEMLGFMKCHYDNRMTLLDCLFRRISIETVKRALNNMTDLVMLASNPFLTRADKRKIMMFYKSLEIGFASCLLIVFLASFVFQLLILQILLSRKFRTLDSLGMILAGTFYQFLFLVGIISPLLLAMFSYLFTMIGMTPWARFSRQLIRICRQLMRQPETKALLMLKLNAGKLFFISCLVRFDKLNRELSQKVFSRSLIITLTANVLFITKISIHTPSPILKIFILSTLTFQFIIILGSLFFIIIWTEVLYCSSKVYLSCHAHLANCGGGNNFIKQVKLSNFIEILYTKKQYALSFSSIGKITRKSLFNFLPIYSCLLMFIIPFFYKNHSSKHFNY